MRLNPSRVPVPMPALVPILIPALFVVLWSAGFIAAKIGLSHSGALSYVFLRFALAASMTSLLKMPLMISSSIARPIAHAPAIV